MASQGCGPAPEREGLIPFTYGEEAYQTFYKIFGDLANKKHTPVVVIHGGPGMVHDYLLPFTDLYAKDCIPVIFYDQIGNGLSTHLPHKPPEFWTIDLFVDELVNLINYLDIKDSFSIIGHSWGGMLACEFEVRRQPAGLHRLVLSNSAADMGLRRQSGAQLIHPFPDEVKEGLSFGFQDREKYYKALEAFYAVHCCRVHPFPLEFQYALDQTFGLNGDPTVSSTDILSDWSIVDRLHLVRVPTLLINGRMDFAQNFTVQPYFDKIKDVRWVTLYNSSHSPFYEDRDRYFQIIHDFLT